MAKTQNITNGWEYSFTTNNTASIPVTNIPSSVSTVLIVFFNLATSTTTQSIIQVSNNNGTSYISTGYLSNCIITVYSNTSPVANQNTTNGFAITAASLSPQINSGYLYLTGLNSNVLQNLSGTSSRSDGLLSSLAGSTNSTQIANAFQIIPVTGNITTGTFKIYGLN